jgi:hypothetical protein
VKGELTRLFRNAIINQWSFRRAVDNAKDRHRLLRYGFFNTIGRAPAIARKLNGQFRCECGRSSDFSERLFRVEYSHSPIIANVCFHDPSKLVWKQPFEKILAKPAFGHKPSFDFQRWTTA